MLEIGAELRNLLMFAFGLQFFLGIAFMLFVYNLVKMMNKKCEGE